MPNRACLGPAGDSTSLPGKSHECRYVGVPKVVKHRRCRYARNYLMLAYPILRRSSERNVISLYNFLQPSEFECCRVHATAFHLSTPRGVNSRAIAAFARPCLTV